MSKYIYKILAITMVVALVIVLALPSFAAESRLDNVGFWDWSAVNDRHGGGFTGSVTGFKFGQVCASSPDKLHHSDKMGNTGSYDDNGRYTFCSCKHCGESYKVYASDLEQSYSAQVSELPAPGYNSKGEYRWRLNVYSHGMYGDDYSYVVSFNHGTEYSCMLDTKGDKKKVSGWLSEFKAPVSGDYRLYSYFTANDSSVEFVRQSSSYSTYNCLFSGKLELSLDGEGWPGQGLFDFNKIIGYAADSIIIPAKTYFIVQGQSSQLITFGGYFELACTPVTLPGNTYNIESRPTSITGDYGIIGDNGQITKVEGNTIVNETNNTYYNPATGNSKPIKDWSYNYEDRSYTLTLDDDTTSTVTYGDENVTIKEGDTVYNVYYLVESMPPDPATCNHSWTETSNTPATCTVPGSRILTCSLCNQTKIESIPALGHKWEIKQTVSTQYDETGQLTQQGYTIFECSVCHEQYKSEDGTAPPGGADQPEEGSGFLDSLAKTVTDTLESVLETVFSIFDEVPSLFDGFLAFLSAMFPFLPPEIITLLTFGIAAVVFIGIIKAIRR